MRGRRRRERAIADVVASAVYAYRRWRPVDRSQDRRLDRRSAGGGSLRRKPIRLASRRRGRRRQPSTAAVAGRHRLRSALCRGSPAASCSPRCRCSSADQTTYDPTAWLIWGREIVHGGPVDDARARRGSRCRCSFTTPAAPFGDDGPAAALARRRARRRARGARADLPARLAARGPGRRRASPRSRLLMLERLRHGTFRGDSEGLLVAPRARRDRDAPPVPAPRLRVRARSPRRRSCARSCALFAVGYGLWLLGDASAAHGPGPALRRGRPAPASSSSPPGSSRRTSARASCSAPPRGRSSPSPGSPATARLPVPGDVHERRAGPPVAAVRGGHLVRARGDRHRASRPRGPAGRSRARARRDRDRAMVHRRPRWPQAGFTGNIRYLTLPIAPHRASLGGAGARAPREARPDRGWGRAGAGRPRSSLGAGVAAPFVVDALVRTARPGPRRPARDARSTPRSRTPSPAPAAGPRSCAAARLSRSTSTRRPSSGIWAYARSGARASRSCPGRSSSAAARSWRVTRSSRIAGDHVALGHRVVLRAMNAPRVGRSGGVAARAGRGPVTLRRAQPRALRQRTVARPSGGAFTGRHRSHGRIDRHARSAHRDGGRRGRRRRAAASTSRSWSSDSMLHLVADLVRNRGWYGVLRAAGPEHDDAARPRRPGRRLRGRERQRARPGTGGGPREARGRAPARGLPDARMPTLDGDARARDALRMGRGRRAAGLGPGRGLLAGDTVADALVGAAEPSGHRRGRGRGGRRRRSGAAITVMRRWARKLSRDLAAGVAILGHPRAFLTGPS